MRAAALGPELAHHLYVLPSRIVVALPPRMQAW
jgi:hypothetical protein